MAKYNRFVNNAGTAFSGVVTPEAQWSGLAGTATDNMKIVPFTATITSAAAATAVNVIPDSAVGSAQKVYVLWYMGRVNGTTVWGTTATVKLQDTNGTPVDFVTMAVAALTSQARVFPGTANITSENAFSLMTGGTAGKGLQLIGDANGTGSDLVVSGIAMIV